MLVAALSLKGVVDWDSVDSVPVEDSPDPSDTEEKHGNRLEEPDDEASANSGAQDGVNKGADGAAEDVKNEDHEAKVWLNGVDIFLVAHFALIIIYL